MLASYPENKDKPITKLMLANAAAEQMGVPDGKDNQFTEAIKHVNGMKEEYGQGASTLLVIANQTGEWTFTSVATRLILMRASSMNGERSLGTRFTIVGATPPLYASSLCVA